MKNTNNEITFGWLDYSKEDSASISTLLAEMEKTTIEHLGFSGERNFFRGILFPGVVNPITRLRYHYFSVYIANNIDPIQRNLKNKIKKEFKEVNLKNSAHFAERNLRDILYI